MAMAYSFWEPDSCPGWFQEVMLPMHLCFYNAGFCSSRADTFWAQESPFYRQEWSNEGSVWDHLRRLWQSLVLPKSQPTAFCPRNRFPLQLLPSQACYMSTNDIWLKTHLVVVWRRVMHRDLFECIQYLNECRKITLSGLFALQISSSHQKLTLPCLLKPGQKKCIPRMCKNFWHEFLYMHIYILASAYAVLEIVTLNSVFCE